MSRRSNRKRRDLKKSVFIICEGKNTEPIYFQGIKEQTQHANNQYAFEIVLVDTPKTDPIGLVNEAKAVLKENDGVDEAWAVFDHDGYTKHDIAFDLAERHKPYVQIAFTSIAFEHWVLLHFERNAIPYEKSGSIVQYLRKNQYIKNYTKKKHFHLYKHTKSNVYKAFENSAWLRYFYEQPEKPVYQRNPYSNVDTLVKKLLNINTQYVWLDLYKRFSPDDELFFTLTTACKHIKLQINNHRNASVKISDDILKLYIEKPNKNIWYKEEIHTIVDEHYTIVWDEINIESFEGTILHLIFENHHFMGYLNQATEQPPRP